MGALWIWGAAEVFQGSGGMSRGKSFSAELRLQSEVDASAVVRCFSVSVFRFCQEESDL